MSKFYITTSIPYVNAAPHIGFAMELCEADAIARYHRLKGEDVFFLTGTDDNALKTGRAAEAAGRSFKEFSDENALHFKNLEGVLAISNNDFIRTSDQTRHWPGAQELWRRLVETGDIYKSSYKGLYCVGHEAFVTEKELVNGLCPDHGKAPEVIEEENYFFKLSKYQTEIKKRIESGELQILPDKRRNEVLAFMQDGLQDISFSRPSKDIPWGIPVPGDASQSMYVWCDALSNYITALGFGEADNQRFLRYWPADVHLIGKDIVRFHAIIWIGMLLAVGLPLPKTILVHGFIVSGGKKMSKTLGNVVDPADISEKYGAEALRYFLLREIPIFEDGDFTMERFEAAYNGSLANGLGNLVSRSITMAQSYFDGKLEKPADAALMAVPIKTSIDIIKDPGHKLEIGNGSVSYFAQSVIVPAYEEAMHNARLNEAMDIIWKLVGVLDKYVQDYEPFKLIKTDKEKTQAVLWQLLSGIHTLGHLLLPFMPRTAEKMLESLGHKLGEGEEGTAFVVKKGEALFPRLENKA